MLFNRDDANPEAPAAVVHETSLMAEFLQQTGHEKCSEEHLGLTAPLQPSGTVTNNATTTVAVTVDDITAMAARLLNAMTPPEAGVTFGGISPDKRPASRLRRRARFSHTFSSCGPVPPTSPRSSTFTASNSRSITCGRELLDDRTASWSSPGRPHVRCATPAGSSRLHPEEGTAQGASRRGALDRSQRRDAHSACDRHNTADDVHAAQTGCPCPGSRSLWIARTADCSVDPSAGAAASRSRPPSPLPPGLFGASGVTNLHGIAGYGSWRRGRRQPTARPEEACHRRARSAADQALQLHDLRRIAGTRSVTSGSLSPTRAAGSRRPHQGELVRTIPLAPGESRKCRSNR